MGVFDYYQNNNSQTLNCISHVSNKDCRNGCSKNIDQKKHYNHLFSEIDNNHIEFIPVEYKYFIKNKIDVQYILKPVLFTSEIIRPSVFFYFLILFLVQRLPDPSSETLGIIDFAKAIK